MAPSEFWALSIEEFFWLLHSKNPPKTASGKELLSKSEVAELLEMQRRAEEKLKHGH